MQKTRKYFHFLVFVTYIQVNHDQHKGFWMDCLSDVFGKIRCISNIEGDVDKEKYADNGKQE